MSAEQDLARALVFLEFEKLEQGEKALIKAIDNAEEEDDTQTLVSAMCCLGDLLYSLERDDEAKLWLEKVIDHKGDDPDPELSEEFAMAEEFLANLK